MTFSVHTPIDSTEDEFGLTSDELLAVIEAARDTREDYTPKTPIFFPPSSHLG